MMVAVAEPHTCTVACQGRSSKPHFSRVDSECRVQRAAEKLLPGDTVRVPGRNGKNEKTGSMVPKCRSKLVWDRHCKLSL